jgi:hypothetical protein
MLLEAIARQEQGHCIWMVAGSVIPEACRQSIAASRSHQTITAIIDRSNVTVYGPKG